MEIRVWQDCFRISPVNGAMSSISIFSSYFSLVSSTKKSPSIKMKSLILLMSVAIFREDDLDILHVSYSSVVIALKSFCFLIPHSIKEVFFQS